MGRKRRRRAVSGGIIGGGKLSLPGVPVEPPGELAIPVEAPPRVFVHRGDGDMVISGGRTRILFA